MIIKKLLFYISLFLLVSSCQEPDDYSYKLLFVNNTSSDIEFLFPVRHNHNTHFMWGNMENLAPTDTSMKSAGAVFFAFQHILPNSSGCFPSGFSTIEEMSPYDTVRIFVYDGSYHYEKPAPRNPESFYINEEYYCRFDFTLNNIRLLLNEREEIEISFPPDERMSSMKMWPPYDTVLKECAERESETR